MGGAASPIADRRQQSKMLSRHSRRYAAISAPAAHFGAKPPARRVEPNPFSRGNCTPEGVGAPLTAANDLDRYAFRRGKPPMRRRPRRPGQARRASRFRPHGLHTRFSRCASTQAT